MSYQGGLINAPVSVSDPYYVMGVGQYNGTWDLGYICSNHHGAINKWSRKKPYSEPDTPEETYDPPGDFGLEFDARPYDPNAAISAIPRNCVYKSPKPMMNWARLTDFIGYNHNAKPPLDLGSATMEWNTAADKTKSLTSMPSEGVEVPMSDIVFIIPDKFIINIRDCHLYAHIFRVDVDGKKILASKHLVSDNTVGLKTNIPLPSLPLGDYLIYLGFDTNQYRPSSEYPLDRYLLAFTDDQTLCPNPLPLKVFNSPIYDFGLIGYTALYGGAKRYTNWNFTQNYLSYSVERIQELKKLGFSTKLSIHNSTSKPLTFELSELVFTKPYQWDNSVCRITYPSLDRNNVEDSSVYYPGLHTLVVQPGITTFVNVDLYMVIESEIGVPLGRDMYIFDVTYKGIKFTDGDMDIEI